jgi:hypothetical protein
MLKPLRGEERHDGGRYDPRRRLFHAPLLDVVGPTGKVIAYIPDEQLLVPASRR